MTDTGNSELTPEGHDRTHSIFPTRLFGFLLVVILACLACVPSPQTDADDKSSVAPHDTDAQDLDGSEEETLLLRYYPPPNELPRAQLVSDGAVKSATDGIILSADWKFTSAAPMQVESVDLPFIWPDATSIDSSHSVIRFHTDVEPGFVFVEGHALFRPDDIGKSPSVSGDFSSLEGPLAEYECSRFQTDSCMQITSNGFVEIHGVPVEMFELPHILVFAKWSIDPEDDPDGLAMANWVFHVDDVGEATR